MHALSSVVGTGVTHCGYSAIIKLFSSVFTVAGMESNRLYKRPCMLVCTRLWHAYGCTLRTRLSCNAFDINLYTSEENLFEKNSLQL